MKKLYFVLLLIIVSFGLAIAGDTIKVLRIYNGGVGTTIPLANIDSINHSKYDADSVLNADYITSVTWAIDSIYQIPINSIDSAVVTEIDVDEYWAHIESIRTFIDAQGELEVNQFQKDLITWLDTQDWVYMTKINDNKDFITITFTTGIDFYVDFQDASFYDEIEESNNTRDGLDLFDQYYDVSNQKDEEIIDSKDILYIQCRTMNDYEADYERDQLRKNKKQSPIEFDLVEISKSLSFLNTSLSNYGLIIISQTHGTKDKPGAFQVEDNTNFNLTPAGYSVCFKDGDVEKATLKDIFWVSPRRLVTNNVKSIIVGCYCWSYGLATPNTNNATIVGYSTPSNYYNNREYLIDYTKELFHGRVHVDAMKQMSVYNKGMWLDGKYQFVTVIPATNKPKSKQRYFSISTNDVDEDKDDDDKPKISGTINGYDNLKKDDLNYILYVHESDDVENTFTPEVAKDGEGWILGTNKESYLESFTIDEKGNFSLTYPGTIIPGKNYGYIFAFEYKDKYYYGELKNYKKEKKEDIVIDEEVVDLGLSVKWATQNLGASAPNELGNKYDIDDFKVKAFNEHPELFKDGGTKADFCKTDYDYAYKALGGGYRMPSYEELKDLKEKCKWELATIGDVAGFKITGPSGKYIFLPTVSTYEEFDNFGSIYTLDRTVYSSGTYDNEIGWSLASISISGVLMPMFESLSTLTVTFDNDKEAYIRPVCE